MDWTEQWPLFYVLVSTPFILWIVALVILYRRAERDGIVVQTNLVALAGALIGFCSVLTLWGVVERYYDVQVTHSYFVFLLFTYPLTVLTPIAGIGNAAVLLYAYMFASERDATIEPMAGYLLGWASVVVLLAAVVAPLGLRFDSRWRRSFGSRFLTLFFSREEADDSSVTIERRP